jgi:hypothetical protein
MGRYAKQEPKPVPEPKQGFERWEVVEPFRGPLSHEALPGEVISLPDNYGGYRDHVDGDKKKPKSSPSQALRPYTPKEK